jgi:hypothetical protein
VRKGLCEANPFLAYHWMWVEEAREFMQSTRIAFDGRTRCVVQRDKQVRKRFYEANSFLSFYGSSHGRRPQFQISEYQARCLVQRDSKPDGEEMFP